MKLFRFDEQSGKPITQFGSIGVLIKRLVLTTTETRIDCMYLGMNSVVGYHQAVGDQLFLVVQGQGEVRAEGTAKVSITAGQAAFWKAGEWHETTSATGLTAIVIEAEIMDPARFMVQMQ
jgi:quercetin dioxygenase-like cupin family protein